MQKPKVLILIGSDSDLSVVEDGITILKEIGVPFVLDIASAHRHPEKAINHAKKARDEGFEVIIAVAGMAAHLPGILASHTTLPVIGVPVSGGILKGVDALLSIVQMPKGIPVATVGIDASRNAAILACEILSIKHKSITDKLTKMKKEMEKQNEEKSAKISNYLRD